MTTPVVLELPLLPFLLLLLLVEALLLLLAGALLLLAGVVFAKQVPPWRTLPPAHPVHIVELSQVAQSALQASHFPLDGKVPSGHVETQLLLLKYVASLQSVHVELSEHVLQLLAHATQVLPLAKVPLGQESKQNPIMFWLNVDIGSKYFPSGQAVPITWLPL